MKKLTITAATTMLVAAIAIPAAWADSTAFLNVNVVAMNEDGVRVSQTVIVEDGLITSGPSLNGNSVSGAADGARQVRSQQEAGYDFLKIHPGLDASEYASIADAANELGIPFAGHVPAATAVFSMSCLQTSYWKNASQTSRRERLLPEPGMCRQNLCLSIAFPR